MPQMRQVDQWQKFNLFIRINGEKKWCQLQYAVCLVHVDSVTVKSVTNIIAENVNYCEHLQLNNRIDRASA